LLDGQGAEVADRIEVGFDVVAAAALGCVQRAVSARARSWRYLSRALFGYFWAMA